MPSEKGGLAADPLREQIESRLAESQQCEEDALGLLQQARENLARAKAQTKSLRAMLKLYGGEAEVSSPNKKLIRPMVERLLSEGSLPEDQLMAALEQHLRNDGIPLTGLGLVVRSLRKDFCDEDGIWSVSIPETDGGES